MTACRYKPALIHNTPSRRTLVFTPEQQPNVRWRLVASITVPSKIIHINIQYINKKPFLAHHAGKKAWRVKTDEPTPACSINTHPYNKVHGFFSFVSRNIQFSFNYSFPKKLKLTEVRIITLYSFSIVFTCVLSREWNSETLDAATGKVWEPSKTLCCGKFEQLNGSDFEQKQL